MSAVSPSPARRRATLFLILVVLALAGYGAYAWWSSRQAVSAPAPSGFGGPVPVRVTQAERTDLVMRLPAIGTVTPLQTVTVRSQVEGSLDRVHFTEGGHVKAGDLLAEIDPRPYRVRLAQAQGRQQQNAAQLANAQADLARYRTLLKQDSIARQQLETQEALVRQYRGVAQTDQAAVDEARLQLDYTRIGAPLSGRIGLRRVDAGNLVRAGDTDGLAVITQMQPISVVFSVPETRMAPVLAALRAGQSLTVEAWDRAETTRLALGTLDAVDNQIDLATGTLRLRARFANDDEALFPNQFVNVRLAVDTLADAVVIPVDAVQYGSRGTYVYGVDADNKARVRLVTLGQTQDGQVAVREGLQPGEAVVLEGLDRLSEGRAVRIVNDAPAS